jgi:hypothetical protein
MTKSKTPWAKASLIVFLCSSTLPINSGKDIALRCPRDPSAKSIPTNFTTLVRPM